MAAVINKEKMIRRVLRRVGNPPPNTDIQVSRVGERNFRINFWSTINRRRQSVIKSWYIRLTEAGHVHLSPPVKQKIWENNPFPKAIS